MLVGVQTFLRSVASLLVVALGATTASAQTAPAPAPGDAAPPPPPASGTAPPPAQPPPPGGYQYPYGQYPYSPYPYPYPYPGYPPAAAQSKPKPRVLPYHEGQRIPDGYYLEDGIHRGAAIAGAAVLGGSYGIGIATAAGFNFVDRSGWLALPVAGPFITAAARHDTCPTTTDTYNPCTDDQVARTMLILDGLAQTTGAILLVWGLNTHTKQLVREDAKYVVVMPTRVGSGYGLGVTGNL